MNPRHTGASTVIKPIFIALFSVTLMLGCDSATTAPTAIRVTPVTPSLKEMIDGVAKSGEIGSGAEEIRKEFDKLKASDAAKAGAIQADFDALMAADGNPAKVKKLAADLAAKL
jgi:hypothetical protein